MNLWANRIGQLVVLAVALFFLSCQDEASLLGYKNPNSKFKVNYIELPIESSVLLLDSQRTSNYTFSGETNRFLIGQYADDKFGQVSTTAYTQFFTNTSQKLPVSPTFDSVSLQFRYDFYTYGSKAPTSQTISVYELSEDMSFSNVQNYFNKSEIQVNPTPLGGKSFTINPVDFNQFVDDQVDTTIVLKIPLDRFFGQRIFDEALGYSTSTTDTTFITFSLFSKMFKGIALKSDVGDKVIGLSPSDTASYITLHYHTIDSENRTVKHKLKLGFFNVPSFNQIKSDRAGTALAGLNQYSQDFNSGDFRYAQSGVGIFTKLDFKKFFDFADTVPNIIINSAELSVESVEAATVDPPSNFILRILQNNKNFLNRFSTKTSQDLLDFVLYNPTDYPNGRPSLGVDSQRALSIDPDSSFYVLGDQNPNLAFNTVNRSYNGNYTLFFQQLSLVKENKTRFQYFVLFPASPSVPSFVKTVNRAIFPTSGIKLKVYYTKPTTPLN